MAATAFIKYLIYYKELNITSLVSIIISLFSVYYVYQNNKRNKYSDSTNFHIIQNLWDPDQPRFSLTNESTKKLRTIPSHYYIMLIPSKVHFRVIKHGKAVGFYFLVLQVITKQIDYLKTIGAIETSYLPPNFYTKKGIRDNVYGKILKPNDNDNTELQVETLPMILTATELEYKYLNSNKTYTSRFLTTPVAKIPLSKMDLNEIFAYVHDNADLEVKPKGNESIYKTVNDNITHRCYKNITNSKRNKNVSFLGIKQGRNYGQILKALSYIITPVDPMAKYANDKYRE